MKTNYFYILLKKSITFAILIAIFLSNKNMAQEILNGDSSLGEISVNGEIDNWTFTAQAGDTIHIQIAELSGFQFEPFIRLYNPMNELVVSNFGTNSADLVHRAMELGVYRIEVLDSSSSGIGTGNYRLFFTKTSSDFIVPVGDEGGLLRNGDTHRGEISLADLDIWRFQASANQSIHIQIAETLDNNTFDPEIRVYDQFGNFLANNSGLISADVSFQTEIAGDYFVVIKEASADVPASGSYALYFANVSEDFIVPEGDNGGQLINGGVASGTIDLGDIDIWTFTSSANESVLLQIGETQDAGGFDPQLLLYDPLGNLVATNFGTIASDLFVSTPISGVYRVIVKEASADVPSSGSYNLYYTNTGQAVETPQEDQGGALLNGGIHEGRIELGDIDAWTFEAEARDRVLIQIGENFDGGGFDPQLLLFDSLGRLVTTNTGTISADLNITLPTAGSYTVIVKESSQDVPATGNYRLYFSNINQSINTLEDDQGGLLENGGIHQGSIPLGDIDVWNFNGRVNQTVHIQIAEAQDNGGFDPQILLYDPNGRLVQSNSGTISSDINASLSVSGVYSVVVKEASVDVPASGDYSLYFINTSEAFNVPTDDEGGVITPDVVVTGEIELADLDVWRFEANTADSINIQISELLDNGGFDPAIFLYDPLGRLLASSSNTVSANISAVAPLAGEYTLVVREASVDVPATGSYEVLYTNAETTISLPSGPIISSLQNGIQVAGIANAAVADELDFDKYTLSVQANEIVRIRLGDLSNTSNFDPALHVFNESGDLIAMSVAASNNGFADLTFRTEIQETLTVVAFNSINTSVSYNYDLNVVLTSQPLSQTQADQGVLRSGELLTGTLRPGDIDVFELTVQAGEYIHIRLGDLSNTSNFDPALQVLDSTGNLLASSISVNNNGFAALTLRSPVNDTLSILSFNSVNVADTYNYEISAAVASQALTQTPADQAFFLRNGELFRGTIRPGDLDVFKLQVQPGELIRVRVGDTSNSSNFDPAIEVTGSNGNLLASSISTANNGFADVEFNSQENELVTITVFNSVNVAIEFNYEISAALASQNIVETRGDQARSLSNGETINGSIRPGDIDVFEVFVTEGDFVRIKLGDTVNSSNFDPALQILDSNGELLGASISANNNGFSEISFTATSSETLKVLAFNSVNVATSFNYEITAAITQQAIVQTTNEEDRLIENGELIWASLGPGDIDVFDLSVEANNIVRVRAGDLSNSSNFDVGLQLIAADGELLASSISPNNNGGSAVEYKSINNETIQILVFNTVNVSSTFNYELSTSVATRPFILTTGDESAILSNSEPISGVISIGDIDNFIFGASEGQSVEITYTDLSPSTSFNARIIVFDSAENRVAQYTSLSSDSFIFDAPRNDVYYLKIFNDLKTLAFSSSYEISITGTTDNLDSDSDALADTTEFLIGTNRNDPDTDRDGLSDGQEFNTIGTNPLDPDTDGDGRSDGQEVRDGTNPTFPDTINTFNDDEIPFLPPIAYAILAIMLWFFRSAFRFKKTNIGKQPS